MKNRLFLILVSLWMLQSCGDLFSTAEVSAKPDSIHQYGNLLKKTKETAYLMTEKLIGPDNAKTEMTVTRKNIVFKFQRDSVGDNGDSLFVFRMVVSNVKTGEPDMERLFLAKFEESSIQYTSLPNETGPRFFLLKTASGEADNLQASSNFFQTLPSVLLTKSEWKKNRGRFKFDCKIAKLDTLVHKNGLEETWLVKETVSYGSQQVMSGSFWYGKSGMLKSVQIWEGFDFRNSLGKPQGEYKIERTFTLI
jgi:hypothetical protein